LWVAESPDKTYFIVTGVKQNGDADQTIMAITKLNASDGTLVWEMDYTTGLSNGVESVAFLSDGSFVVGGYTGSYDGVN
jgi:outer membrane protein assembly factor BamB